jgi:hypothetical protein
MNSNRSRYIAGGLLAVGLSIGAALAATPGVASADPSSDPYSLIDQLLGGLSVPAQTTSALDMQVSIDGTDMFPTAGNTATATSETGDIAIAIGNGADASAVGGTGDFAFADGANSLAEAGWSGPSGFIPLPGNDDIAVVVGTGSTAAAGYNGNSDTALVFGDDSTADAGFCSATCGIGGLFPPGNFDFGAVFGDKLTEVASYGTGLFDIQP